MRRRWVYRIFPKQNDEHRSNAIETGCSSDCSAAASPSSSLEEPLMGDELNPAESFRAGFVRRAIQTDAPLLAASLNRYALSQSLSWSELAEELGCSEDRLNRLACCRPPRPDRLDEDILLLSQASDVT